MGRLKTDGRLGKARTLLGSADFSAMRSGASVLLFISFAVLASVCDRYSGLRDMEAGLWVLAFLYAVRISAIILGGAEYADPQKTNIVRSKDWLVSAVLRLIAAPLLLLTEAHRVGQGGVLWSAWAILISYQFFSCAFCFIVTAGILRGFDRLNVKSRMQARLRQKAEADLLRSLMD